MPCQSILAANFERCTLFKCPSGLLCTFSLHSLSRIKLYVGITENLWDWKSNTRPAPLVSVRKKNKKTLYGWGLTSVYGYQILSSHFSVSVVYVMKTPPLNPSRSPPTATTWNYNARSHVLFPDKFFNFPHSPMSSSYHFYPFFFFCLFQLFLNIVCTR